MGGGPIMVPVLICGINALRKGSGLAELRDLLHYPKIPQCFKIPQGIKIGFPSKKDSLQARVLPNALG